MTRERELCSVCRYGSSGRQGGGVAKLKDFLLQLENDQQLLRDYRTAGTKQGRKDLAKREGLDEEQAELLQSNNVKKIKKAIEDEDGGAQVLCIVMVE